MQGFITAVLATAAIFKGNPFAAVLIVVVSLIIWYCRDSMK